MKLPFTIAAAFAILAVSPATFAGPAEDLIASNKCSRCHTATTTKKGPSWASVAEKYKADPAASDKLVKLLKTGGSEDHNKVVASDADLKAIVALVLASK